MTLMEKIDELIDKIDQLIAVMVQVEENTKKEEV